MRSDTRPCKAHCAPCMGETPRFDVCSAIQYGRCGSDAGVADEAAIDRERDAGDEGRLVGEEEPRRAVEVRGLAELPHRRLRDHLVPARGERLAVILQHQEPVLVRDEEPRRKRVDAPYHIAVTAEPVGDGTWTCDTSKPEYQGKGINAVLFYDLLPLFISEGYKYVETNPELEVNSKVQSQWIYFERRQHKRRRCYKKSLE